jgi:hypothetical protein
MNKSELNDFYSYHLSYNTAMELSSSLVVYDLTYLFIVPLVSLIGVILNIISFKVIISDQFKGMRVFSYLRVYILNSLAICLISFGLIMNTKVFMRRFIFNFPFRVYYVLYIYIPLVNTCYFSSCLMDLLMVIEQIYILKNKTSLIKKRSPYLWCLMSYVVALVFLFPSFFIYDFSYLTIYFDDLSTTHLYVTRHSDFVKSGFGKLVSMIMVISKNVLTLVLEISFSIYSVNLLRRHLKKKSEILNKKSTSSSRVNNELEKKSKFNQVTPVVINQAILEAQFMNTRQAQANKDSTGSELKTTIMLIAVNIVSIVQLFFIAVNVINSYFVVNFQISNRITLIFYALWHTFIALKHASNFLVFLLFNKQFKNGMIKFIIRRR